MSPLSSVPAHRVGSHLPSTTRRRLPFDPREELFARSPRCRYCNKPFKRVSGTTADHIRPISKGGETRLSNLALCCRGCNQAKGNRTPFELVRWSLRVLVIAFLARVTGGAA